MYDILVYLFENCQQAELADDRERVARKLSAAGFEDADISEALHWLAGVLRAPRGASASLPDARASFRAFAPRELIRLGQRVVVARGQKRPQLEGHLPRQEFVQDDRRVLALNCGNRLAQQCASGFVLERREKIAREGEEMLEA